MSTDWLEDLEEKVQAAASRLRDAKADNERLRERVKELEEQVAGHAEAEQAASTWASERDAIRERVVSLAGHLEELLEE